MDEDAKFELIDSDGLSTVLAEEDWRKEVGKYPENDVYEIIASPIEGEIKDVLLEKQPKSEWATLFFDMKNQYLKLIRTFRKE